MGTKRLAKTKKQVKFEDHITTWLDEWTDEECLNNAVKFFDRVDVSTKFIENADGLITHQLHLLIAGDKVLASDPVEFEWPLQRMPMPEAFVGALN